MEAIRESTINHIAEQLEAAGIATRTLVIDVNAFRSYLNGVQYLKRWPWYFPNNLEEKALEHYLAIHLLKLTVEDIFVDVAAATSPLAEIVSEQVGCASYSQDLIYPPGVRGNKIGGDACALPVPDGFFTAAALTCSLEHFEGTADMRLFGELGRVLRRGSRVVIVPLYLNHYEAIQTDPGCYSDRLAVDEGAVVHVAPGWGNRFGRFYSVRSLRERILSSFDELFLFEIYRVMGWDAIGTGIYARWLLLAQRR